MVYTRAVWSPPFFFSFGVMILKKKVYFVVSWSLSGAYILLGWIESHVLILSGGETCHIKPTSFTYTIVLNPLISMQGPHSWCRICTFWHTYRMFVYVWDIIYSVFSHSSSLWRTRSVGSVHHCGPDGHSSTAIGMEMCTDLATQIC